MHRRKLVAIALCIPLLGASCTETAVSTAKQGIETGIQTGSRLIRESGAGFTRNLSDEQKIAIDEWLSANSLNDFGDAQKTFYAGGTPLFDESTGKSKDRFEYLFEKFPELKTIIQSMKKDQTQKQPE